VSMFNTIFYALVNPNNTLGQPKSFVPCSCINSLPAQPKVADLGGAVAVDKAIRGLQIAMKDAGGVNIPEKKIGEILLLRYLFGNAISAHT
jgi:hypothetical protein